MGRHEAIRYEIRGRQQVLPDTFQEIDIVLRLKEDGGAIVAPIVDVIIAFWQEGIRPARHGDDYKACLQNQTPGVLHELNPGNRT